MASGHSWEVRYPQEFIKYIELFRVKYIPYDTYDRVLGDYLRVNVAEGPLRILSLGCGTGQHEVNLAAMGHFVVALDRDEESLRRASDNALAKRVEVQLRHADLLRNSDLGAALADCEPFDVVIMLGVQLSMADHAQAARLARRYLRVGGAFVTGLWGYVDSFDADRMVHESCVEIAEANDGSDFAVRLNTYRYFREGPYYFIDWDAVYLYPGPDSTARMHRRETDRIEVAPERSGEDPLGLAGDGYVLLPSRQLLECGEAMCLPHTYEYLIGWRKS